MKGVGLNGFWKREDDLEQRLRRERPVLPAGPVAALMRLIDSSRSQPMRSFRLGLAAAVSAVMLVALAAFGGLGYAASSVKEAVQAAVHIAAPHTPAQSLPNSAAAQYGAKVDICTVQPNGKQHTISISENAAASFLRTHPKAYLGSCGAFRPKGSTPNVCVRLGPGHFVAIWVRPSIVSAYLGRNFGAHRTTTGKC
jgi:hypothetical protein